MDLTYLKENELVIKYLIGSVVAISLFGMTLLIQKTVLHYVGKKVNRGLSAFSFYNFFYDLVFSIKKYFIFSLSVYIVMQWMTLSARVDVVMDKAIIIVFLFQLSHCIGILINAGTNQYFRNTEDPNVENAPTVNLIIIAIKVIMYSGLLLVGLNNLGVNITALVAGLGVGGIAIGLALQNILTDLFSSLTIVLDKPFEVGDFIVVGEFQGTIEKVGLKTTRMRSLSGEQLVFGNGDLLQSRIKNYKRMEKRRIVQSLTVTYQTKPELLNDIPGMVKDIVNSHDLIQFERCHFLRFLDSSLEFELVFWINSPQFIDYADRAHSINVSIFKAFTERGIDFAYPTQTVILQK